MLTLSPLPRERTRAQAVNAHTVPSPPGENQGTGGTVVSLFPLPLRERARVRGRGGAAKEVKKVSNN